MTPLASATASFYLPCIRVNAAFTKLAFAVCYQTKTIYKVFICDFGSFAASFASFYCSCISSNASLNIWTECAVRIAKF